MAVLSLVVVVLPLEPVTPTIIGLRCSNGTEISQVFMESLEGIVYSDC